MSLLNRLYETYNRCLENDLVDNCKNIDNDTVLLPLFHTNKRSNGADIIEITLDDDAKFIDAQYLPKDDWIIFPVTEDSIARSSGPAPHPLCDSFKYLSNIHSGNHEGYLMGLENWYVYSQNEDPCEELTVIRNYAMRADIATDIIDFIYKDKKPSLEKYNLTYFEEKNGKEVKRKVDLEKIIITFKLELHKTITVTKSKVLHLNYEKYQRYMLDNKEQNICDISNQFQYCTSKHRGLFGNSKIISISCNPGKYTYYGRFKDGKEIMRIGYETSQKIHNMLKYLMDNPRTSRFMGKDTCLVNWFSDNIGDDNSVDILDEYEINIRTKPASDFLLGNVGSLNENNQYYVLVLDNISPGRISIKYFRELSKSDLYERVKHWYETISWSSYDYSKKETIGKTFPLYRLAELAYGTERDAEKGKGKDRKIKCDDKLKKVTIERLLPCIIDRKPFPRDIQRRMVENATRRMSYKNKSNWDDILEAACALIKKCNADYGDENKKEVSTMLDKENTDRSYLYGRLLAIGEKVEKDTYEKRHAEAEIQDISKEQDKNETNGDNSNKRLTNAERLWTVYTRRPATTWMLLEEKLMPYYAKLAKTNKGSYYRMLVSEIMNNLEPMADNNKKLSENFVLGYYHQRKDLYTRNKQILNEEEQTHEYIEQEN